MLLYSGPFRIQFKQSRDHQGLSPVTGTGNSTATFDVMWEPRLRPMLHWGSRTRTLKIVDDQDKPVAPQVSQEANETGLRAGNCAAELNLNLIAPERAAKTLSSLKVKGMVTVPAGMKTFKFPNLAATNVVQKQGDISVTLESTEVDESVWKVSLAVSYPAEGPAFNCHSSRATPIIALMAPGRTALGSSMNGGFNNSGNDGGTVSFGVHPRRRPRACRVTHARLRDPRQGRPDPARVRVQGRAAPLIGGRWIEPRRTLRSRRDQLGEVRGRGSESMGHLRGSD